jgi:c(7)-type cytochrome triheme protein
MRNLLIAAGTLVFAFGTLLVAADKGPEKMVFPSKMGDVTFQHEKHSAREKEGCKACHDKIFPQKKAPLNFKIHKAAETKKVSCASAGCHHPGGRAFATTVAANCKSCHVKGAAKAD